MIRDMVDREQVAAIDDSLDRNQTVLITDTGAKI